MTDQYDRHVLKRPCEMTLTPDQARILCGDKFGDVYSLPLLVDEFDPEAADVEAEQAQEKSVASSFVPSANEFTVHTARNRETLRRQLRANTENSKQKTLLPHLKPILGHVSMLTDLKCVSISSKKDSKQHQRTYIITADRDEHIRVSRGPPQTHIIETFCQGHTQFVSRICIPHWNSHILFSGGGESDIFVWDWLHGKIIQKVNIHQYLPNSQANSINATSASEISQLTSPVPYITQPRTIESQISVSLILAIPENLLSPSLLPTGAKPSVTYQIVIGFTGYVSCLKRLYT